ncbi:unnamed protein product [Sphacelaria rigidula]
MVLVSPLRTPSRALQAKRFTRPSVVRNYRREGGLTHEELRPIYAPHDSLSGVRCTNIGKCQHFIDTEATVLTAPFVSPGIIAKKLRQTAHADVETKSIMEKKDIHMMKLDSHVSLETDGSGVAVYGYGECGRQRRTSPCFSWSWPHKCHTSGSIMFCPPDRLKQHSKVFRGGESFQSSISKLKITVSAFRQHTIGDDTVNTTAQLETKLVSFVQRLLYLES